MTTTKVTYAALPLLLISLAACVRTAPSAPAVPPPIPEPPRLVARATLVSAPPQQVGMDPALGARLESVVADALADTVAPGVAVAVGRWGRLVHLEGYGTLDWPGRDGAGDDARIRPDERTVWDLASLTKVVATTTAAMILEEEGRLHLDSTVAHYLGPDWVTPDPAKLPITVRMLLTHSGGLEAYAPLHRQFRGREEFLLQIASRPLAYAPGTRAIYSDWDMVILQLVIESITGQTLDAFANERIFQPLGLRDTGFLPNAVLRARTAPTATDTSRALPSPLLKGVVHDGNAWALGGVAGHAGLFSSARDLAVFAQMLLNDGIYDDVRIVRPQTIARWTAPQAPGSSRALGWDTPSGASSAGRYFSPRAYGHTGFTGTSMWLDPDRGVFIVLLTNRVHPTGSSSRHVQLRRDVADVVSRAILDAPLVNREPRP